MTSWSKKSEVVCPECGSAQLDEQFGQYRLAAVGSSRDAAPAGGACACFPDGGGCGAAGF